MRHVQHGNQSFTKRLATRILNQRSWRAMPLIAIMGVSCATAHAADAFVKPTREELAMTSLPGYPGVPAVLLFREEITRDDLHNQQHYERLKILTEEGKKYANVELGYVSSLGGGSFSGDEKNVDTIMGRTIHADGAIVPFTGKPYLKVLEKTSGYKVQAKVFTLPDVQVGSIIEYRYDTRINDHFFESPTWSIQNELYLKQGHFVWFPTSRSLVNEDEKPINSISWFPILPEGTKVERREVPAASSLDSPHQIYELAIRDVPPLVKEEYRPPLDSFSYRVRFNFTPYRSKEEFWTVEGKRWSKNINNFANANASLSAAAQKAVEGATSPEDKLRHLYAAVMELENTSFTRDRDRREDKAAGLGKVSNAADVLSHGRGSPTDLARLFLGMAKAAGFPAYAMLVPDRSQQVFVPEWMNFNQFDDTIVIVKVDGKEVFLDPGTRYCAFGQLAWQHTFIRGLRQVDGGGTVFAQTPGDGYKMNRTARVANLTMDAQGEVTGKIDLTFQGAAALRWRQAALRGDDESLKKELRSTLEEMTPRSLEVEVAGITGIKEYQKPLVVNYNIKGTLGSVTGKRMVLPADLFLANASATFPHEKRETAVYFHYPQMVQDAVRINLPHSLALEATPASFKLDIPKVASYAMSVASSANNFTTRRDFVFGDIFVLPKEYAELRSFYSQFEAKDQESVILKSAPPETSTQASAPAAAP